MSVKVDEFGKTAKGEAVFLYTLENENGLKVVVTNIGACIVSIYAPDRNGKVEDLVTGFDDVAGYEENKGFFGAVVGPYANRTAKARFVIDGKEYQLAVNENDNNLHSDFDNGLHKKVWDAEVENADNSVVFAVNNKDMELGFPGNRVFEVTYTLTNENGLRIKYHATSDQVTPVNLTNHTYFNLRGDHSGTILDTVVTIDADQITPVFGDCIPTGEFMDVTGTPFDFREPKTIGAEINTSNEQIEIGGGYDHNFVLNHQTGEVRLVATAYDPVSGRKMEVYTDLPGMQLYTGNFMENAKGKNQTGYNKRDGFCMETQAYPNSINQAGFPDVYYGPGKEYNTVTEYRFLV